MMKRMVLLLALVALTVVAVSPSRATDSAPAAKVGETTISQQELQRELENIRQRFQARGRTVTDEQLQEIKKDVLERMIRREILFTACKRDGVQVSDEAVEQALQSVKDRYPSADDFAKMMASMHLTEKDIKADIARELVIRKMIDDKFVKTTSVSEAEMKEYYEKTKENFRQPETVRARHILIKVAPDASAEAKAAARAKIDAAAKRLAAGEDFAAVAREVSEGPSGPNGGDLGVFRRGQMVKPFEEKAFAMEPGTVSDVVETRFGYHLIKVEEKNAASVAPFEEVRERIGEYLKQEKVQQKVTAYIEELKASIPVQIL